MRPFLEISLVGIPKLKNVSKDHLTMLEIKYELRSTSNIVFRGYDSCENDTNITNLDIVQNLGERRVPGPQKEIAKVR